MQNMFIGIVKIKLYFLSAIFFQVFGSINLYTEILNTKAQESMDNQNKYQENWESINGDIDIWHKYCDKRECRICVFSPFFNAYRIIESLYFLGKICKKSIYLMSVK